MRREFREIIRKAFNSVLSLLGGPKEGDRGKLDSVSQAKMVEAVLDFAKTS